MRPKQPKPSRLSGDISDLPFRDVVDLDAALQVKGGATNTTVATQEIISPRDPATGLPTGKRS